MMPCDNAPREIDLWAPPGEIPLQPLLVAVTSLPPLAMVTPLVLACLAAAAGAAGPPAGVGWRGAGADSAPPKPPCPATQKPAAVAVAGFGVSAGGCIGAQGHGIAMSVNCDKQGLNVTAAAAYLAALCSDTPACAAFSIISPEYPTSKASGRLLCELHPETIKQSSQLNQWWSVWQKTGAPKPGTWPSHPVGPPPPPPTPPAPPPATPIKPDLLWTSASTGVMGSMPLGNGKLGVNVWADSADTVWLLLSHIDAIDENTNLDKLGRVKIEALLSTAAAGDVPYPAAQAFKQEMHLQNSTVTIDLTSGISVDVWVSENDEFCIKTRNCVSKTRNCVLKTRSFVFKNDGFCR